MADGVVRLRQGESRPVFGGVSAPTGSTVTIQGAPTYTLYDSTGGVKLSGSVTGYDAGAQSAVRAWTSVDATSLAPGSYTLAFRIAALGSDGVTRVCEPTALVVVEEVG